MATTAQPTTAPGLRQAGSPTPWYKDSKRQMMAAGGAVALVALGAWFVVTSSRRKEDFAAKMLSQAIATADRGNLPQASSELQKVIQTYKGTDAATEAVITLNQVRMANNQTELAVGDLKEFLASKPPVQYAAPAYALLGAANESGKKFLEAGAAYEQAAAQPGLDYVKADYLLDAGRAYRDAGKTQDAIRVYRMVVQKYPTSPSFGEAQVRLAELTAGAM